MARVQGHMQSSRGTVSSSPLTHQEGLRVEARARCVEAPHILNKYVKGKVKHGVRSLYRALVTELEAASQELALI